MTVLVILIMVYDIVQYSHLPGAHCPRFPSDFLRYVA